MSPFVDITGVTSGARIVGIDTRPSDNSIYSVATDNKLYRIDPCTGNASLFSPRVAVSVMVIAAQPEHVPTASLQTHRPGSVSRSNTLAHNRTRRF